MDWRRWLGLRELTPTECRASEIAALKRRVSVLEAEGQSRQREIERLRREAAAERLDWEERTDKLEATLKVREHEVTNMAGMLERYRALVESCTAIDAARAEAAAAMARRPANMGGFQ